MQRKHQGAKGGFAFCPFSERPTTRAREALFAMSSPASGHPRWDGPKAHRSRGEGGWAALRTRAALLLDRRPGHHTTTKTTPLMWWRGIMQGLRLTPAHPRQARGSRLGRLSSLPPSRRPIPTWSNCFIRQALNREETKGDEGSLDVFPTVLMECGSWQVTALTAVGKLQHPTGHRILGMA